MSAPLSGTVKMWDNSRGFGFAACRELCCDVFCHISALHHHDDGPARRGQQLALMPGEQVTLRVSGDGEGRTKAVSVSGPGVVRKSEYHAAAAAEAFAASVAAAVTAAEAKRAAKEEAQLKARKECVVIRADGALRARIRHVVQSDAATDCIRKYGAVWWCAADRGGWRCAAGLRGECAYAHVTAAMRGSYLHTPTLQQEEGEGRADFLRRVAITGAPPPGREE